MLRKITTSAIILLLGLLGLSLLWPERAELVVNKIQAGITQIEGVEIPLLAHRTPKLKIVDPAVVASALRSGSSAISNILDGDKTRTNELAIEDIIDATNKERIDAGMQPLKSNELLIASAKIKVEDMINLNYFEHESPTGKSVSDLGRKVGYDYIIMGENLALGDFSSAKDLLKAWMESPGHKANILSPLYQEIGVYAMQGEYDGRQVWFAVQHFGTGRSSCPSVSKTLKVEIDRINLQLTNQQNEISELQREIEGMDSEDPAYKDKVNLFNAMVNTYNETLATSRGKIALYNKQVSGFNACLTQYQK